MTGQIMPVPSKSIFERLTAKGTLENYSGTCSG
jgi:hypothetical protein